MLYFKTNKSTLKEPKSREFQLQGLGFDSIIDKTIDPLIEDLKKLSLKYCDLFFSNCAEFFQRLRQIFGIESTRVHPELMGS